MGNWQITWHERYREREGERQKGGKSDKEREREYLEAKSEEKVFNVSPLFNYPIA